MQKPFQVVFAFACALTLVFAQTENPSSPGAAAKTPTAPAAQNEANPAAPNPPEGRANGGGTAPAPSPALAAPGASPAAPPAVNSATPAKGVAEGKAPAADARAYVIGPLDVLVIKVWNQPNLSGAVNVGADGMISLQLIGEIKAEGLTAKQLRDVITQRLKECCVNNPEGEVNVEIAKNNSKRYYVYGGVIRGGEYPLDRDTTVMDAMSLVGGFRDFSNKKKIRVLRGTQTFYFNYNEVSKGKHLEQNILLQNGDRIFVPE